MASEQPCYRCGGTGREPDLIQLGGDLRKWRVARGWTLKELARRAGSSPAYVGDMEHGRRAFQAEIARRIVAAVRPKEARDGE